MLCKPMLQRSAEAIVRHLDGAFARIWTLNDRHNVLELQASAGLSTRLDGEHDPRAGGRTQGWPDRTGAQAPSDQ